MSAVRLVLLPLAVALAAVTLALAQTPSGPTFDCAKASGSVETLICKDAALGALDRRLADVYKAAGAKATGAAARTLRAEQRGWVGGRNECWKASAGTPTFLTESLTADSPRGCVEWQYKLRIAELQAVWRLLPGRTVSYACNGNPANEIVATFFASEVPAARLERGDRTVTAYQVPTASGARYEGRNVWFFTKGEEATASWMNEATGETQRLSCRAR